MMYLVRRATGSKKQVLAKIKDECDQIYYLTKRTGGSAMTIQPTDVILYTDPDFKKETNHAGRYPNAQWDSLNIGNQEEVVETHSNIEAKYLLQSDY